MANVHVDYQDLQSSANQLKSGKDDIEAQLARLKSVVDGLVSRGFVTDLASGKFSESYQQWNTGAKNVIGGLEGMVSFLQTAISMHQDLDSKLSQQSGG